MCDNDISDTQYYTLNIKQYYTQYSICSSIWRATSQCSSQSFSQAWLCVFGSYIISCQQQYQLEYQLVFQPMSVELLVCFWVIHLNCQQLFHQSLIVLYNMFICFMTQAVKHVWYFHLQRGQFSCIFWKALRCAGDC